MANDELLRWFEHTRLTDRPAVGGKGASLGELLAAGIRVPPGFTVTTAAFEHFLTGTDPAGATRRTIAALDPDDLTTLNSATAAVRDRIRGLEFPPALCHAVAAGYATLGGTDRDVPVAVRSSATSEDSAEASFAGLQDTVLWVRGADAVMRAILGCWSSLYNAESVSYRLRLKLPEAQVAMGVVVQRMIDSRCAGVMFTRSPTSGDRSVIAIEGSWGLGSSIVSGEVTPDKFVVNKVTGDIMQRAIACKQIEHVPDREAGGVRERSVDAERLNVPCLTDAEITEIARIGKAVERHYGAPQDIEWAIAHGVGGSADLYLLQSRPETVWSNREVKPVATAKGSALEHVFSAFGRSGS